MSVINTNIEIKNSEFMGVDVCGICPFLELRLDNKPRKCGIFNKTPERFNPTSELGLECYEYIRLDICKECEVK